MTEREEDRDPAIELAAASILDGQPVDWSSPALSELVEELQVVASIAEIHRADVSDLTGLATWGHLTLIDKLGRGTSGEVFLAIDNRLQRSVALKLLFPSAPLQPATSSTIEEASLLAKVRHPNVVTVFGAEQIGGRIGIITEHVEGRTLAEVLQAQGPLGADEAASIGLTLCRALAAVHGAGLIHRDVKAHNVIREKGGRLVLMDLGSAHRSLEPQHGSAGTPLYLAPEILTGSDATRSSDLYSLGVLLFHLVTGRYPVEGDALDAIRDAHADGRRARLLDLRPSLPPAFVALVERALEHDPARRFQTAGEMEGSLLRVVDPTNPAQRASPRRFFSGRMAGLAATAAVVALTATALMAWRERTAGPAAVPFAPREWVLVVPFENHTGEPRFDGVLDRALEHALSTSAYVNVVPPERVDDALRLASLPVSTKVDSRLGRELALRDGNIQVVLAGSIDRVGKTYPIILKVIQSSTGEVLASERQEPVSESAIPDAIRGLSTWVRTTLGEASGQVAQSAQAFERATTPSFAALRDFSEAMEATRKGDWTRAKALLVSAVEKDTDFASAHIWLAWAHLNLSEQEAALAESQRAAELAKHATDRERHFILGSHFLLKGDVARAAAEFEALLGRYPDDYWGQKKLHEAYLRSRSREDIRRLAVRSAEARPHDPSSRLRAATQELRRDINRARPHFAHALRLFDTAVESEINPVEWLYASLFPAHDLWRERHIVQSESMLASVQARIMSSGASDHQLNALLTFRCTLGQMKEASTLALRIKNPPLRAMALGFVELSRGETQRFEQLFQSYEYYDLVPSSLLVRAGRLSTAERLLQRLPVLNPLHVSWSAAEIEVARGNLVPHRETLEEGIRFTQFGGVRSFLYAETLADAHIKNGDTAGAITVLEEQVSGGDRAYGTVAHLGFAWMRCAKKLADLYRTTDQLSRARAIELDLLAALSLADDDFPLLRELRSRAAAR